MRVAAVLFAEQVYQDVTSKKKAVIGSFNQIKSAKFPVKFIGAWQLYLAIENCTGQHVVMANLHAKDKTDPILKIQINVNVESPDGAAEVNVPLPPVTFPEPGEYLVELKSSKGTPLGSRQLFLRQVEPPTTNPSPTSK